MTGQNGGNKSKKGKKQINGLYFHLYLPPPSTNVNDDSTLMWAKTFSRNVFTGTPTLDLNGGPAIILGVILNFFFFFIDTLFFSIHTATPSLEDYEQAYIVHTGFAGRKPTGNHVNSCRVL